VFERMPGYANEVDRFPNKLACLENIWAMALKPLLIWLSLALLFMSTGSCLAFRGRPGGLKELARQRDSCAAPILYRCLSQLRALLAYD
jgi:hypothetical protein